MKKEWPKVRLGEVLTRNDESIALEPDTTYREITVRLWGKGVVLRGLVTGAEVAAQRRYVARQEQFILSRIDARNGALGIVPPELDGAITTNDFPVFRIAGHRLLPAYLGWLSRTASFVEESLRASEGTTNRVRLQESKFLARELPLPPLAEQRRVVARIEELAGQIHEVRSLRQQAIEETEALLASSHRVLIGDGPGKEWIPHLSRRALTTGTLRTVGPGLKHNIARRTSPRPGPPFGSGRDPPPRFDSLAGN